ncbi:hypothetical protein [Streptomyces mexicanus]|uniref:hypothetical protein n=1 Tax=Streptomyces mexicanus TaxID=178566 RepID=UPI0031F19FE4
MMDSHRPVVRGFPKSDQPVDPHTYGHRALTLSPHQQRKSAGQSPRHWPWITARHPEPATGMVVKSGPCGGGVTERHFDVDLSDLDAVAPGLTLRWSSGAVEGHVDRIKMLKRQVDLW